MMAERRACAVARRLDTHSVKEMAQMNLRVIAIAMGLGGAALVAAIWMLV